ncbi:hypothetical protein DMENIID0001_051400 [Sergentomyia squamirostris]
MSENLTVREQMQSLYQFFGHRDNIIWDCYQRDQKIHVRNKVALVFGLNKDLTSKSKETSRDSDEDALLQNGAKNVHIESTRKAKDTKESRKESAKRILNEKKLNKKIDDITEAIWNQAKYTDGVLMMSIVYLAILTTLNDIKLPTLNDAEQVNEYSMYPLFRIMKCVKNKSSEDCCMIFVDDQARVYSNWSDFRDCNVLPDSIVVAPRNGIYNCDQEDQVLLEFFPTPSASIEYKILNGIDKTADIVGIIAAVAALIAIGLIAWVPLAESVSVVIFTVASLVSAVASAWTAMRSGTKLVDRKKHERPNSLDNREARSCWLGAIGGGTGLIAGMAGSGLAHMIRNGHRVPAILRICIDIIFITNIIMQKLSLVNEYFDVMFKVKDGEVSAFDFIRLAATIAVFIHSVNNFRVAKSAIRGHQQSTISAFRDILSADQQKVFDKMARETIRIRGEYSGQCDIIRNLRNNPLAMEAIDSKVKANSLIRQQNWRDTSAHTANAVKNFKGILHEEDLASTVVSIQNKLSDEAFIVFRDLVNEFVNVYGEFIEKELNRFIPFEEFLSNIFILVSFEAEKKGQTIDAYIFETEFKSQQSIFEQFFDFFKKFRIQSPNELCHLCGGKYLKLKL